MPGGWEATTVVARVRGRARERRVACRSRHGACRDGRRAESPACATTRLPSTPQQPTSESRSWTPSRRTMTRRGESLITSASSARPFLAFVAARVDRRSGGAWRLHVHPRGEAPIEAPPSPPPIPAPAAADVPTPPAEPPQAREPALPQADTPTTPAPTTSAADRIADRPNAAARGRLARRRTRHRQDQRRGVTAESRPKAGAGAFAQSRRRTRSRRSGSSCANWAVSHRRRAEFSNRDRARCAAAAEQR